jgi:radical SAM protein with 4Fe4S-binding SPASM domain
MNSFPSEPEYIQFYPTLRCNLSCPFCFNRGIKAERDIPINDCEQVIGILSDIGVKEIDILGGEPTLHTDFSRIVKQIYKKNLKANISSNGSNIHLLKNISQTYEKDQIQIGVSINYDSVSRELHKYIIEYKPFLKSVCSKEQTFPKNVRQYLRSTDIQYYLLFMDAVCVEDLKISLSFPEYFQRLNKLKTIYKNVEGVFCSGFIPDTGKYPVLQYARCPAGTTKLTIMPDGTVYPCYLFVKHDNFRLGNILFDDFVKIWKNPLLDFFRNFKKNNCINTYCKLFSLCHGGCPAVTLLISGSLDAPEPRCVYRSSCRSRSSEIVQHAHTRKTKGTNIDFKVTFGHL